MIKLNHKYFLNHSLPTSLFGIILGIVCALSTSALVLLLGPAIKLFMSYESTQQKSDLTQFLEPTQKAILEFLGVINFSIDQYLIALPALLVIVASIKAITGFLHLILWDRYAESITHKLRYMGVRSYLNHSSTHASETDQEVAGSLGSDSKIIKEYITRFYGSFPKDLLTSIMLLIILFWLSINLTIILILSIIPIAIISSYLARKVKKRSKSELIGFSDVSEWLQQRFNGIETIKQYGTEEFESEKLKKLNEELVYKYTKTARAKARTGPIAEVFTAIGSALILLIIFYSIYYSSDKNQSYLTFFACVAILSQSTRNLNRYFNFYHEAQFSLNRLSRIINLEAKTFEKHPVIPNTTNNSICLKNVSYSHSQQENDLSLNDINFDFSQGKLYLICGSSGSGKSTLIKAIAGILPSQVGTIEFLVETRSMSRPPLIYVPQHVHLLPGSIAENIAYPNTKHDDDKIKKALQCVELDPSIMNNLNLIADDGSSTMSGGEIQRVLLARIFYHKPKIIIIDEGTSALDEKVEHQILKQLSKLKNDHIIIMVAHRKTTLEFADEILLIKNSRLIAHGNLKKLESNFEFNKLFL